MCIHAGGADHNNVHGMQEEQHPSAMGVGQPKEGFSVFGMFNKCVSPMGKRLLKLWFRRPIINLSALNDRQASMACSTYGMQKRCAQDLQQLIVHHYGMSLFAVQPEYSLRMAAHGKNVS
jgi:hypothetical protein